MSDSDDHAADAVSIDDANTDTNGAETDDRTLPTNRIVTGDCFDVLQTLPDDSVHACVTDPPYGLAFMGESWDDFEPREYQDFCRRWAEQVFRVLKPGGHLIAFSGNRTHHRMMVGVEDAGFEIRDTLTWHYKSGFPKAMDLSKAIDRRLNAYDDREVVESRDVNDMTGGNYGTTASTDRDEGQTQTYEYTIGATDEARQFEGWKTGLKPATEFAVLAMKPADTHVDAALEHGTGGLNIEDNRIGDEVIDDPPTGVDGDVYGDTTAGEQTHVQREGRYPPNVAIGPGGDDLDVPDDYQNFVFCPKAHKTERTLNGRIENAHPTVKPGDLMTWLIRLVTHENQVVIDPFTGSGTTCRAAKDLNRRFVGIEREPYFADVARVRAGLTPDDPSIVRDADDDQAGLAQFDVTNTDDKDTDI